MISFHRKSGLLFFAFHSFLVIAFGFLVRSGLQHSAEASMMWIIWIAIDFPIGLAFSSFDHSFSGVFVNTFGFDGYHTYVCSLFFLLAGGMQYLVIGGLLGGLVGFENRKRFKQAEEPFSEKNVSSKNPYEPT